MAAERAASAANGFLLRYRQRLGLEPDYYRCLQKSKGTVHFKVADRNTSLESGSLV